MTTDNPQALEVWPEITLKIVGREDGGMRLWSPNIPGLVLSTNNPAAAFRDLPLAIHDLIAAGQYEPSPSTHDASLVRELVSALEPFSREAEMYEECADDVPLYANTEDGKLEPVPITVGDLRRASRALSRARKET